MNNEPVDFNTYVHCRYRTENSECEKTNDDCFIDDVPWSCPLKRAGQNEQLT